MDRLVKITPTEIIEDALNILSGTIYKKNIIVQKRYALLPLITIQKAKFMHILLNLIKNAIEAMEDTPVAEKLLIITTDKEDSKVIIGIKDKGKGICATDKEKLFSIGFSTGENGHGFGLYSCMLYIEEMQGEFDVISAGINQGAEFRIKLPFNSYCINRIHSIFMRFSAGFISLPEKQKFLTPLERLVRMPGPPFLLIGREKR